MSARELVNEAINAGRGADCLDVVIRARYACESGNGDELHRELADEVEQLRAALAEVREHATREASIYGVSADQYAEAGDEARMDADTATAAACKEIAALIDRLVPTLRASASSADRAEARGQIPRDDPWGGFGE